ncbi:pilus assembly protein PilY [Rheinheimera muenzenbergensis]|uniref:Pilus assembly protein PilY n=1 Tax=Rheinheimera muenzenbergensis TaxID=1193628 RepID=A0ABU8C9R4_9GAMM
MLKGKNRFTKLTYSLVSICFGLMSGMAAADLAIPKVPLQTGSDVPVNLMFVIDDSGSMAWSYIPDGIRNICKNNSTEFQRRRGRSPDYNEMYFNPATTYIVPPKADGTSNNTPSFTNAPKDGYSWTGHVDLSKDFRATWYYQNGSNDQYCGEAGAADYYLFDKTLCNDVESNSCYRRYKVAEQSSTIKKNFAIWYSYYRSRKMASLAGIGRAFATLPEAMRVGYGAINNDPVKRGVREFSGTDRSSFFSWLYGQPDRTSSTPLRGALKEVGEYFKKDEPYLTIPEDDKSGLVSCRQNFSILMSDGGWNEENSPDVGNADGDGYSNTLADVAYKYWSEDLRTGESSGLVNNVPTSSFDNADWQHMVTYTVGLGVVGSLKYEDVKEAKPDAAVWTNPGCATCAADPGKVDDFIHAAVNGKGGFFSAKSPQEFADQLTSTLRNLQLRTASASNLASTTTTLQQDNSVFQASFNTKSWTGDLVSRDVKDLTKVQWRANFPELSKRKIYTSRNNVFVDFDWDKLNAAEQAVLKSREIVDYLRGDQTKEKSATNPSGFRERVSLLGDIAHSSPVYVAAPQNRNYQRYGWEGAGGYASFLNSMKTRSPVVYVGANDGMLHGFNADTKSSTAGQEIFAYVPRKFVSAGSTLASFSSTDYEHQFFVDGSPVVNDVYINGAWRSILIGTLGRGGNSIFALDVTKPTEVALLWDLTLPEIGIVTTRPTVARLNDGSWSVLLPYGYNNSANKDGIIAVDIKTGTATKIEAPAAANGLSQIEGWDADGDGNTDWFFSGDLNGNVWKFDLSGGTAASWKVAYNGSPLFTAKDKSDKPQPITGGITLSTHPKTAQLWVFFGTGKFNESGDSINADTQSWYGITDGSTIGSRAQLVERTMANLDYTNPDTSEVRPGRRVPVASETDLNGKRGWVMDLIDSRERITSQPRIIGSNLVMNTIIPDSDLCNPQGDGWIMAVDPYTGGRLDYHFFDLSRDKKFEAKDALPDGTAASGVKFQGMPGEPVFDTSNSSGPPTMIINTTNLALNTDPVNLDIKRGRLSWREVSNQ